jgi:hypothetical protein
MPRVKRNIDYTKTETLLSFQNRSTSAGLTSAEGYAQAPNSASFRFSPPGSPLRSTQQLPVDWSNFANHTFFSSAVANVNVAFDKIINNFPFDGTFREVEDFFDTLTGYEAYVFNQFPKSLNSLAFSGSSYIEVVDSAGSQYPELSRNITGASVLDPGLLSLSLQTKLFVPSGNSENQVIAQRVSSGNGYTLCVSASATSTAEVFFSFVSGSTTLACSASVPKGQWNDVAAIINRRPGIHRAQIYISGALADESPPISETGLFTTLSSPLYIGSGSNHASFTFSKTLSGSLDDFKLYVGNRTPEEIRAAAFSPSEPSEPLRLYYRFNEPSGSYDRNAFVIDSSGNGLHSTITGFAAPLRNSSVQAGGPPSFGERPAYNPVLFPDYSDLVSINTAALETAEEYDTNNPNYIIKLIPGHYLEQEQRAIGLPTVDGKIGRSFSEGGDLPRATQLGSVQLITSLLLIWAKQFDEMKMFIDQMSRLNSVGYTEMGGIADTFIPFLAREFGIELPRLFSAPTYLQYVHGDNSAVDSSIGTNSLYELEADIWRRILASLPTIVKSKGTTDSVKSIIRSIGIDPDVTLRFKEYGGTRSGYITGRKSSKKLMRTLSSGSFLLTSPYLSASRVEPGAPLPSGGTVPNSSDGLLTSGSFTFESHFLLDSSSVADASLARLLTTGSFSDKPLLFNVILQQSGTIGGVNGNLTLSGAYSSNTSDPQRFSLEMTNLPVYDGYPFYVSFGRNKISADTSEVFLRFGKSVGQNLFVTESIQTVVVQPSRDVLSLVGSANNASGAFFQIGTSAVTTNASAVFLNYSSLPAASRLALFSGKVSQVRFWSKHLSGSEWSEHVRNPFSFGVANPSVNFNFVTSESGSFERLRLDCGFDQPVTASDGSGNIALTDFSQNGFHLSGTGFPPGAPVIGGFEFLANPIDPYFDESSTDQKVRVKSWTEETNVERYGGRLGAAYTIDPFENSVDDNRFGIEISMARALNEDIVLMLGGHEPLDSLYGNSADAFALEYTGERHLRDIYFNRLVDAPVYNNVFLFAKWFELNLETLISQVMPFNTNFLGSNFVVESHALERKKVKYGWSDIYLGREQRSLSRSEFALSDSPAATTLTATVRRS